MRPLVLLALLLTGTVRAQTTGPATLQDLVARSPFAPAGPSAAAAGQALEFRGTFVDAGERFFSIVDPATRRAEWVGLNEPGRSFVVRSYDPQRETVVVEHQGRTLDLKLPSARIGALPAAAQAVAGQPPAARPAVNAGETRTDAQRLAQVAEEIRRRRALRQQQQKAAPASN